MKKPLNVEDYINNTPPEHRDKLKSLRNIIRSSVPEAEEKLSYSMPYYSYKGRLAYFALSKNHIGLYIPPPIISDFKVKLKNFKTATSTVQFPLDKPLPEKLIRELILARKKFNDKRE